MTDNERISKWRGECGHSNAVSIHIYSDDIADKHKTFWWWCPDCGLCSDDWFLFEKYAAPIGWTPALFQAIEDAGINSNFIEHLKMEVSGQPYCQPHDWYDLWQMTIATPAQKSTALARAIEEMEGK